MFFRDVSTIALCVSVVLGATLLLCRISNAAQARMPLVISAPGEWESGQTRYFRCLFEADAPISGGFPTLAIPSLARARASAAAR